jgi:hypothetical protein
MIIVAAGAAVALVLAGCSSSSAPGPAASTPGGGSGAAQKVADRIKEYYCDMSGDAETQSRCQSITGYAVSGGEITVKTDLYHKAENEPEAETIARAVSASIGCGQNVGIGTFKVEVLSAQGDTLATWKPAEAAQSC